MRSGVHQLDKILKKLSSLIFYSDVHRNASNEYHNVKAFKKVQVEKMFQDKLYL